ncbi:hypothetical protein JTB14_017223 [Gonioctena quinquepunctata]|nr:hypothetical protein JTB14_017223 [Gonioctena quinquepunctata]
MKGVRQKSEWSTHLPSGSVLYMSSYESYWDDEAASPSNMNAGFRATDIYHDGPNIIPDVAFAPSESTTRRTVDQKNIENEAQENDATKKDVTTPYIPNATAISLQKFMRNKTVRLAIKNTNFEIVPAQQAGPSHARRQLQTSDSSSGDSDFSVRNTSSEGEEIFSGESDDVPLCKKKF